MSSSLDSPAGSSSRYRFSLTRVAAVAFTVFALVLACKSYVDYCVIEPTYAGTAQIEVIQPSDPDSPEPMLGETEIMLTRTHHRPRRSAGVSLRTQPCA
jgi:hypothetical protein